MHRLALLALALTLTACQSNRKPSIASGPTLIQGFDANGNATMTSYSGRTSAGAGQVNDTSKAGIFQSAMDKVQGNNFTLITATRSAVIQPNYSRVEVAEKEHKDALTALGKATPGTNPYAFAENMVRLAADNYRAAREAEANAPKPDDSALDIGFLSSGDGHAIAAAAGMEEFGLTLRSGKRSDQSVDLKSKDKDNSTAADMLALAEAMKAARLHADAGKTNAPPVAPTFPLPPVVPFDPAPVAPPASTNIPPVVVTP